MYTSAWRSSTSFESCRCSCSFAQLIKNWAKVFRSKLSKPKISIREIHGPSESAAPRAWLTSATSHSNSHAYSARTRPSCAALSSAPILGLLTVSTFPAFTVRTVRASWNCCGSSPKHSAAGASFPAIKWSMPSSTDQIRSCFSSSSPSSDSAVQIFVKASGFSPVSRSFRNSVTMWKGRSSITRPRSSRKVDTDAPVKAPLRSKWIWLLAGRQGFTATYVHNFGVSTRVRVVHCRGVSERFQHRTSAHELVGEVASTRPARSEILDRVIT